MNEIYINAQSEAANPPPAEVNPSAAPEPDNEFVDIQAVDPELPPGAEWVDDMLFDQEIQNAFDVVFGNEGGQQNTEVEQEVPWQRKTTSRTLRSLEICLRLSQGYLR